MLAATQQEFIQMRVSDVRRRRESAQDHIVLLTESDGPRRLPIWTGRDEAVHLALRFLGAQLERPLTHDLAARLVHALGGSLREVRIDRLTDKTYYAVVVLDGPTGPAEVDARPSDALTLALITGAPIRVDREVVEAIEASGFVARSLAAMGSEDEAGPRAILDQRFNPGEHQDPAAPGPSRP
jgi:bifunctional DNase/RNase